MTRIISGRASGTRLDVPANGTRPTSDRVRESLFSALEATGMLPDAVVVDLYAGSGALGLEALSRGAARADVVERDRKAAAVAQRNADRVARATGSEAVVHTSAVATFLRASSRRYDIAFVDPPYDLPDADLAASLDALRPLLVDDALVIVERASRSGPPAWEEAHLRAVRDRRYGDTTLWWGEPTVAIG